MKKDKQYNLILQILEIVSDKQCYHINYIITKLVFINNISIEDRNRLIKTNNDKIIIKGFDQDVQIALMQLLVFGLIQADKNWSLNIEYTTSYRLTNSGMQFINQNTDEREKIRLLKMKMYDVAESFKKK